MTVHYKRGDGIEGFNATYTVLSCPDNCPNNRECRHGQCLCPQGMTGPLCSNSMCPNNCSAHLKQGVCDTVSIDIFLNTVRSSQTLNNA